jgi:two-component system response regulator VicR
MRELVARVKANIRRNVLVSKNQINPEEKLIGGGAIVVDNRRYEIRKNGKPLHLTLREFELFRYLAENKGKVFSRAHLLNKVWGNDYSGDVRTIDVTIKRLREKVEDDGTHPKYVKTKRGVGYYFEPTPN